MTKTISAAAAVLGTALLAATASSAGAGPIYSSGFEGSDGGWSVTAGSDWERGIPVDGAEACDGPESARGGAHQGSEVWATNLDGCHANAEGPLTISQSFDLSAYETASFSWWQRHDIFIFYDRGELRADGQLLYEVTTLGRTDWAREAVSLDAFAGGTVELSFTLQASQVINRAGWYLDEMALVGERAVPVPEPTTASLLLGGLAALAFGRRRRGAR